MYTLLNYNSLETVKRANYLNVLTNCRIHVLSQFFALDCDDLFAEFCLLIYGIIMLLKHCLAPVCLFTFKTLRITLFD